MDCKNYIVLLLGISGIVLGANAWLLYDSGEKLEKVTEERNLYMDYFYFSLRCDIIESLYENQTLSALENHYLKFRYKTCLYEEDLELSLKKNSENFHYTP